MMTMEMCGDHGDTHVMTMVYTYMTMETRVVTNGDTCVMIVVNTHAMTLVTHTHDHGEHRCDDHEDTCYNHGDTHVMTIVYTW